NYAGTFDLVFYDSSPTYVGTISDSNHLTGAIRRNAPTGGGTCITEALRGTVQRYHKRKGIYIIVITDGEFADKQQAQNVIMQELLPRLTPENPLAFRMHFVGAGHEVDREFLEQLEATASSGGIPMVAGHHHAHISHAQQTITQQLDTVYVGHAVNVEFRRQEVANDESHHIARIGQQSMQNWTTGEDDKFAFLPRQSTWMIEVAPTAAHQLKFEMLYTREGRVLSSKFTVPMVVPTAKPAGWRFMWTKPQSEQERAEHEAALARQREDLKALAHGDIPVQARQRLKELREDENAIFTSNLDPAETALLRRVGYEPIATVGGSAMYHVGQAYAGLQDCEVPVLSNAYDEATRLAVSRMEDELKLVAAHGIVGVRFQMIRHEWSDKTIEVQVLGTAVRGPGKAPDEPWLCDLSGHEWWALYRAGYEPVELVWGHCSWFIYTDNNDYWTERSFVNQEYPHWSQALSKARTHALNDAKAMARQERAHGIVGVRVERRLEEVKLTGVGVDEQSREREHHNLLVSILGTAIRVRPDAPRAVPASALTLSLLDGGLTPSRLLKREVDAKFE
ncbi:MAG: hypothetical protein ACYCW6_19645, partial [Candidatus Xenobia bacterium]